MSAGGLSIGKGSRMAESGQTKLRGLCAKLAEENAQLEAESKKLVQQIVVLEREILRLRASKSSVDRAASESVIME
jgi:hypothetical protein